RDAPLGGDRHALGRLWRDPIRHLPDAGVLLRHPRAQRARTKPHAVWGRANAARGAIDQPQRRTSAPVRTEPHLLGFASTAILVYSITSQKIPCRRRERGGEVVLSPVPAIRARRGR